MFSENNKPKQNPQNNNNNLGSDRHENEMTGLEVIRVQEGNQSYTSGEASVKDISQLIAKKQGFPGSDQTGW